MRRCCKRSNMACMCPRASRIFPVTSHFYKRVLGERERRIIDCPVAIPCSLARVPGTRPCVQMHVSLGVCSWLQISRKASERSSRSLTVEKMQIIFFIRGPWVAITGLGTLGRKKHDRGVLPKIACAAPKTFCTRQKRGRNLREPEHWSSSQALLCRDTSLGLGLLGAKGPLLPLR